MVNETYKEWRPQLCELQDISSSTLRLVRARQNSRKRLGDLYG